MKIGILTYHCPPNFGAQLQTLSTIGYLKRMGHEPIVINWYAKDLEEMYSHRIPANQVLAHNAFANERFPLTQRYVDLKSMVDGLDMYNLDAIIVGSDALFKYVPYKNRRYFSKRRLRFIYYNNPLSCEDLIGNPFWGGFVPMLRRRVPVSVYAASCQNCPFFLMNFFERRRMRKTLKNYNLITVRDFWTKQMIEKITMRKDIKIFPDPVFAFMKNCDRQIPTKADILKKYGLKDKYVLFSFSGLFCTPQYVTSLANQIEKEEMQAVNLPMPEGLLEMGIKKSIKLPLDPLDWYALIAYSSGYVGERMHPIVVCLHNAVPFFCFDEYGVKTKKTQSEREIYDEQTSKTYLIVNEAGFIKNLYSYQKGSPLPTKELVVERLFSFDKRRCEEFSRIKTKEYEVGMGEIMKSLI